MIDVINFEIKVIEYGNVFNVDLLVIFSFRVLIFLKYYIFYENVKY